MKRILVPNREMGLVEISVDQYAWQPAKAWRPKTRVLLSHDEVGIEVQFQVHDQYVLARTSEYGAPVYEDSCVEFFFTPGPETGPYFNIEVNAAGGLIFNRQTSRGVDRTSLPGTVGEIIGLQVEPGQLIQPEDPDPMFWTASYTVPWVLIESFGPISRTEWRANFYKCAEANSHPHFGSWAPIEAPKPDFHRPEYFGILKFV